MLKKNQTRKAIANIKKYQKKSNYEKIANIKEYQKKSNSENNCKY